jgi:hypothetical protein
MSTDFIRKQGLDKFYTHLPIARECLDIVGNHFSWEDWDLVVEPSAGAGSFLNQIPTIRKIGIDISPDSNDIIQMDFLTYIPERDGKILVVGNPPFGRVSSLAIKFFNHAGRWADVIAFIIPRTFRRTSVQNKLDLNYHLIHDSDIPMTPCSFYPKMSVKCCFQIWEKKKKPREIVSLPTSHRDWTFLGFGPLDASGQPTPPEGADFAIRAYGGECGEIAEEGLNSLRPKSWHWIRSHIDQNILRERFRRIDYSVSFNTARQNSIGRADLVKLYEDYVTEHLP